MKLVAINENGVRMGEGHGRAKLTDHDVELVQSLIECREMLIEEYAKQGLSRGYINRVLNERQLSYAWLAEKFEVSKSLIKAYADGKVRARVAVGWKRVSPIETAASGALAAPIGAPEGWGPPKIVLPVVRGAHHRERYRAKMLGLGAFAQDTGNFSELPDEATVGRAYVAALLGVHFKSVLRMVKDGRLPRPSSVEYLARGDHRTARQLWCAGDIRGSSAYSRLKAR